jgi:hypothetical protein
VSTLGAGRDLHAEPFAGLFMEKGSRDKRKKKKAQLGQLCSFPAERRRCLPVPSNQPPRLRQFLQNSYRLHFTPPLHSYFPILLALQTLAPRRCQAGSSQCHARARVLLREFRAAAADGVRLQGVARDRAPRAPIPLYGNIPSCCG